jgi:hypothetical protein
MKTLISLKNIKDQMKYVVIDWTYRYFIITNNENMKSMGVTALGIFIWV